MGIFSIFGFGGILSKTDNGVYKIFLSGKGSCDFADKTYCYNILVVKLLCGQNYGLIKPINIANKLINL